MPKGKYERTPEIREKMRQAALREWADPQQRERRRQAMLGNKNGLGCKHSPEAREKQRKSKLGNKYALGYKHSAETREGIRQATLKQMASPEARERVRQVNLGRPKSPEHREKIRQARLRRVLPAKMTSIERLLHAEFKKRRLKFEMHKPMFGRWQPDFTFEKAKLFVQADGGYWHNRRNPRNAKTVARDDAFNAKAVAEGWTVFRFSDTQINSDAAACARAVARFVRDHGVAPTTSNSGSSIAIESGTSE